MKRTGRFGDERGLSVVELLIVIAVLASLSAMAVFGLRSARAAMRLNNSARIFAQNVERARLDAIRRHDSANVEFTTPTTYEITMDYTGSGVKTTRGFTLDSDVTLVDAAGNAITDQFPYADFDWRGRTSECAMFFQMKSTQGDTLKVQVAGSGDITVNNNVTGVPSVTVGSVSATADIAQNTTAVGTDTRMNISPCSPPGGGAGGGGTSPSGSPVTATCSAGTLTASPQQVTIRRNGGTTGTLTATVTAPGTLAASTESNLSVTTTSQQTIGSSSGGSVSYTVRSLNKTRGMFPVKFTFSNCAPATVYVKVTN